MHCLYNKRREVKLGKSWGGVDIGNSNRGGPRIPKRTPYKRMKTRGSIKHVDEDDEVDDVQWREDNADTQELPATPRV